MQNIDILQSYLARLIQAQADARYYVEQLETQLKTQHTRKVESAATILREQTEHIEATFSAPLNQPRQRVAGLMSRLKYASAPWELTAWEGFPQFITDDAVMGSLRAGIVNGVSFPLLGVEQIPMLLPVIDVGHGLIFSQKASKVQGRALLQSLATRAVLQWANPQTRFVFYDPLGAGANFPFQGLPESMRGEVVLTEVDELDASLRQITDQIRRGDSSQRVVFCAVDVPSRWSPDALTRLSTIARSGVTNQIYTLLHIDSDSDVQGGYDFSDILDVSSVIYMDDMGIRGHVLGQDFHFTPDSPPDNSLLTHLIRKRLEAR